MRKSIRTVVSSLACAGLILVLAKTTTLAKNSPVAALGHVHLLSSTVNPPSVTAIYNQAALFGGYFAENGLDVEMQQSSGSPVSLAAIVSGKAEFASINLDVLANAASQGVKAKTFVIGNFENTGMLVSQSNIRSAKELEGKIMGASALGSSEYNNTRTYFSHEGIDLDKIHWVSSGSEAMTVRALVSHRIDAGWIHVGAALEALKVDPSLKVLVDSSVFSRIAPSTGAIAVVTDAYAAAHPDIVTAFARSLIEASRRLYQNRGFFDMVTEKWMPGVYTPDQKTILYNAYRPSWGVNGGLQMTALENVLDGWKASNPKEAKNLYFSHAADLVDSRFARTVLDQLGVMKGTLDDASWYRAAQ